VNKLANESSASSNVIEVTDLELKALGFEKFLIPLKGRDRNFFVWYKGKPIQAPFKREDLAVTVKALEKIFVKGMSIEKKSIQKFILFFTDEYLKLTEKQGFENTANTASNEVQRESIAVANRIRDEIEKLKKENPQLTNERWYEVLIQKYHNTKEIAEKNFPHSWEGIEFTLSVLKILNIAECTLPFAGIMLARPGANKTLSSELITFWPHVYYSRKFTPKAFVSNSTALDKDQLQEIDMLPRIRFKLLLTPELTPIFSTNEDELRENLGIITSILDGHGLLTDSGAHGRRGYHGNHMFVWVGAAVDIPYRVHKLLATLGPKLYFFRLPYVKKPTLEIIDQLNENFERKRKEVQWAVIDFLIWHEVNPKIFVDKETKLPKVKWDSQNDDKQAKNYLANLAELLGRLRGHVNIWSEARSSFKEHEYSEYSYSFTQTEDPTRATTQLYNLARGHALLEGRNSISLQRDLPIAIKVALSTASVERVAIIDLLLSKQDGELVLSDVADALSMSKATALKAMTELKALKVVEISETTKEYNKTIKVTLLQEFGWLFNEEFKKLREGFRPIDISSYITIREKIVLSQLKMLGNDSSCSINRDNNRLVSEQSLYDVLRSDGFQDAATTAAIDSLIHKHKIYKFRHEDGSMFYGIISGDDWNKGKGSPGLDNSSTEGKP
jgi:hypothetical protein